MYTLNLSKENYNLAKTIDFPEVQNELTFDDEHCVITVYKSDIDAFMLAISEEVDMKGLSEDQEEVTPYGRKLYELYDEVYALKHEQN